MKTCPNTIRSRARIAFIQEAFNPIKKRFRNFVVI